MANLVFDFLHNYHAGERRDSEPANAYQYDEGHVIEAVVPVVVTSCEIHYWIRGMEKAEAYVPDSITPNADGTCTILGHVPNEYFQTNGELRVYIVVTDGDASLTTYEGRIQVCHRSMPDDYVDDDPENEATRVLTEAQEAAATATAAAETCEEVLESIPEDYSQLSDDVSDLKDGFDDLDDRVTALEEGGSGSGLTEDIKQALLQIAEKIAYIDEDGQDYYDALEDALYPPADLVSISAVYTQSGTVYDTDSLDTLKADLVVTAHMSDSTTRTVTDYVLSGTLTEGTSTITVAYGGKTTTFNVTVSHASDPSERWTDGVAYDPTIIADQYYEKDTGAIKTYSGWDRTDYMPCKNAQIIDVPAIPQIDDSSTVANNAFFDASYNVVQHGIFALKNHTTTILVPSNAAYFGVSSESDALATCVADGIIPYAPKSVSNMNGWANGVAYADLTIVQDSYITNAGAIQSYTGWDRTDYVPCNGLESITFPPLPQQSGTVDYCGFYYKDKAFCRKITLSKTENSTITLPIGAYYFIISSERAALASCINSEIVPNT